MKSEPGLPGACLSSGGVPASAAAIFAVGGTADGRVGFCSTAGVAACYQLTAVDARADFAGETYELQITQASASGNGTYAAAYCEARVD